MQVIWVCILCRKKQELLSKTGQWINKGMGAGGEALMRRLEMEEMLGGGGGGSAGDKRPKLERAHSAAEKENQPVVQRAGSLLRRQYSQQEASSEGYQGELEGLMRAHRTPAPRTTPTVLLPATSNKKHKRCGSAKKSGDLSPRQPQPQRSFSSSDDELRSTPECTSCEEHDSEKGE